MFKLLLCTLLSSVLVSYAILWAKDKHSYKFTPNGCKAHLQKKPIPRSSLQPQEWTLGELRSYNGIDKPQILLAVDWRVFDVSSSPKIYGLGGTYDYLAGRDATRSIVLLQEIKPNDQLQEFDDFLDFTPEQRDSLNDWVDYFYSKYPEVGLLVGSKASEPSKEDVFSRLGDHPSGGFHDNLVFLTDFSQQ